MGWIYGLSEGGKRAYHFLIQGIRQGLSGAEILRTLRQHGLGYRIQDFYNDLRILTGEARKWDTMKFVPRDKVITEKLYTPATYMAKGNFITRFEVEVLDEETGEIKILYTSVIHDTPMTRRELEEIAKETIEVRLVKYEGMMKPKVLKIMPVGGYRRV